MKKIKKTLSYIFGSFLMFVLKHLEASAQFDEINETGLAYGVHPYDGFMFKTSLWERILFYLLTPIAYIVFALLAIIIGVYIYVKRKRKKTKKNL